jgi:hypothetical protein
MVRAKFKCSAITEYEGGGKKYDFSAVHGDENKPWSVYTPSARLEITINNPDAQKFEVGKEYYLDFSLAEDKAST